MEAWAAAVAVPVKASPSTLAQAVPVGLSAHAPSHAATSTLVKPPERARSWSSPSTSPRNMGAASSSEHAATQPAESPAHSSADAAKLCKLRGRARSDKGFGSPSSSPVQQAALVSPVTVLDTRQPTRHASHRARVVPQPEASDEQQRLQQQRWKEWQQKVGLQQSQAPAPQSRQASRRALLVKPHEPAHSAQAAVAPWNDQVSSTS